MAGQRRSLAYAAAIICEGTSYADPAHWLMLQLRAGRFTGLKVGREWLMTDADIEAAIESCRRGAATAPGTALPVEQESRPAAAPVIGGLSVRSARRVRTR